MERARDRFADDDQAGPAWERLSARVDGHGPAAPRDDAAEIETFPVMIRLNEIRQEVTSLHQQMREISALLGRMERVVADGLLAARPGANGTAVIPVGITARANPMTHPVTPMSSSRSHDNGRDEALASVRALFESARRRPWWQRLPLIGS